MDAERLLCEASRQLLKSRLEGDVAILPLGSIEWHCGGPLGADTILALWVSRMLRDRLETAGCSPALLPPVYYGASGEWLGYTPYSTTRRGLGEYLRGLLASLTTVYDNIVVVNGHGGNSALLRSVIESLVYDEGVRARFWILEWWRLLEHKLGHMDHVEASLLAFLTGSPQPICACRGLSNPYMHGVECSVVGRAEPDEKSEDVVKELEKAINSYAGMVCREAPRLKRRRSGRGSGTTHPSQG